VTTIGTYRVDDGPSRHGNSVMPSGRLPSARTRPTDSLVAGTLAREQARHMMSIVMAKLFAGAASAGESVSAMRVNLRATRALVSLTQNAAYRRRPTTTRIASLSSR
jgi:hypothetical protein